MVTRRSRKVTLCVRQLSADQRPTTALLIKKKDCINVPCRIEVSVCDLWHGTSSTAPQETKSGSYIYSGSPSGFHEWEFRTRVHVEVLKQKIRHKVLDGFRT